MKNYNRTRQLSILLGREKSMISVAQSDEILEILKRRCCRMRYLARVKHPAYSVTLHLALWEAIKFERNLTLNTP